ncbi:hypothetical protein MNBD_UNCLBAC01-1322 [hydrothermal vent metagenome]|uniref:Metal-binding protein n=1 Tax=hydrothermal vent metagenome TaxID=652676 RepID=A0A3B1DLC3_9ZZZZ
MSEPIHGHDVMQMMIDSGEDYTRVTLKKAIDEKFGSEARFYTCSAESMTAEMLIDFLEQRGKFIDSGKGFVTDPDKICKH